MAAAETKDIDALLQLADSYIGFKNFSAALAICESLVKDAPERYEPAFYLGLTLFELERFDEALIHFQTSLRLNPAEANTYFNIGNCYLLKNQASDAITWYEKALEKNPEHREVLLNLSTACRYLNKPHAAIRYCEQLLNADPYYIDAHYNLGLLHMDLRQNEAAIPYLLKTLELSPMHHEALVCLGKIYHALNEYAKSEEYFELAIAAQPEELKNYENLGALYFFHNEPKKSITTYRKGLSIAPNHTRFHWNLAISLLLDGQFEEGWEEYEWRWELEKLPRSGLNCQQELWDGNPLDGKTLLLHTEQGIGDSLLFSRYIPLIPKNNGKIILACEPTLTELFSSIENVDKIIPSHSLNVNFDLHLPLGSLPRVFKTRLNNIPNQVPYLQASLERLNKWQPLFEKPGFNIGIAWSGNTHHGMNPHRAYHPQHLAKLFNLDNVNFFALQKNDFNDQILEVKGHEKVSLLGPQIQDFADTAAIMSYLDLIISPCTSITALAGALARPVWVPLCYSADWRWLLNRSDSLWYPSAKLFRQPKLGDWESVFNEIEATLQQKLSEPQ